MAKKKVELSEETKKLVKEADVIRAKLSPKKETKKTAPAKSSTSTTVKA